LDFSSYSAIHILICNGNLSSFLWYIFYGEMLSIVNICFAMYATGYGCLWMAGMGHLGHVWVLYNVVLYFITFENVV
jgi:nitroreductase